MGVIAGALPGFWIGNNSGFVGVMVRKKTLIEVKKLE